MYRQIRKWEIYACFYAVKTLTIKYQLVNHTVLTNWIELFSKNMPNLIFIILCRERFTEKLSWLMLTVQYRAYILLPLSFIHFSKGAYCIPESSTWHPAGWALTHCVRRSRSAQWPPPDRSPPPADRTAARCPGTRDLHTQRGVSVSYHVWCGV